MKLSSASFVTVTGAAFNRNPSEAKRRLAEGPVVVTDHGEPSFVLVSASDFELYYQPPLSAGEALLDRHADADRDLIVERQPLASRGIEF